MTDFSVDEKPKQIFRWEDQEIYYFSMALKDFGKDYEYISKIIQTKQVKIGINDSHMTHNYSAVSVGKIL